MNSPSANASASRTWRDIPQPVKPRAMSRGGRWRLAMALLRTGSAVALGGTALWGAWRVAAALRENSGAMPAAAKAVPVKHFELRTAAGGVLDSAWLRRTLALPSGAALMELDLDRLRERLLADRQVQAANLTRHFPDRLVVQISERSPVARIRAAAPGGAERVLLVARDGVVYPGTSYDPALVESLPWLDGFALVRDGAGFRPVRGMDAVSDLLARAQYEAGHLYADWSVVSLARLESDREIEVTTRNGSTVVFSARTDFFPQLAKLDYMRDYLAANLPPSRVRIDFTLGREVPVAITPLAPVTDVRTALPPLSPGFNVSPFSQPKH